MVNNDIIRKIRYTFEFSDTKMIELFGSAGLSVTRAQISNWLKKDDDPAYQYISDFQLASFLTGLINEKRGKSEGLQPVPENKLNNNIIFRKIRIALNLKDESILEILELAGVNISKHELSAFFRNPVQPQFRECKDQILRKFPKGFTTSLSR